MTELRFPDHIEGFVEQVQHYLGFFNTTLTDREDNIEAQLRTYLVDGSEPETTVAFHRTSRSMDSGIGEYRIRVISELADGVTDFVRGKEDLLNRFATMGALITSKSGGCVGLQSLIPDEETDLLAGVVAAAIVHARPSLLEGVRRTLSREEDPTVERLSSWSDLDFEQIHYDYAHIGIGSLGSRNWVMRLPAGGRVTLEAVHNNPYWGGGLLCLLSVPLDLVSPDAAPVDVNSLNEWANLADDTPFIGGWCRDKDDLVFVQFVPNLLKELPGFTDLIIGWAFKRAGQLKSLVYAVQSEARVLGQTSPS